MFQFAKLTMRDIQNLNTNENKRSKEICDLDLKEFEVYKQQTS